LTLTLPDPGKANDRHLYNVSPVISIAARRRVGDVMSVIEQPGGSIQSPLVFLGYAKVK
jgi:hypothetical protein